MIIAVIFLGIVLGAGAAVVALVLGMSVWTAVLIYSAVGAISSLLFAFAIFLLLARSEREEAPLPKITPFSPRKKRRAKNAVTGRLLSSRKP